MNFNEAIVIVLAHEGGYVWDPDDPGGETKYGITKREYPNLNIKTLTKAVAIWIYKRDYWDGNNMDSFPERLQLQMFDMSVNMGMTGAGKVLQRALNRFGYTFQGTGKIGPGTMKAVFAVSLYLLQYWITIERIAYYNDLVIAKPKKLKFLKGWTKRAIDILTKV